MESLRWWFDTALNFTPHMVVFAVVSGGIAAYGRHWLFATPILLIAAAAILWHAQSETQIARPVGCDDSDTITVASVNVQRRFTAAQVLAKLSLAPDVLILEEASKASDDDERLNVAYPYQYRSSPAWLTVLARSPLSDLSSTAILGFPDGRSVVTFNLPLQSASVTVVALHGLAPTSLTNYRGRSSQFDVVERIANKTDGPLIVIGDLNATVHSPALHQLLARTGLATVFSARTERPTWPTSWKVLGIHIDHLLVRDIVACTATIGPEISDHRAIAFKLQVQSP